MKVVEIFGSIQGEGLLIGCPTVFIRFSGCNLRCRWCDTSYAFKEGKEMAVSAIFGSVLLTSNCKWVCLTGGEPLLQDKRQLELLLQAFRGVGKKITVETNGTIKPPEYLLENVDLWSVSPKLTNSGMKDKLNIEALRMFAGAQAAQFKFVIERLEDVNEAFQTMDANNIHGTVILQPQGYGDFMSTLRKIAEYVKANYSHRDVRILPQLHILMYGHRKGI